MRLVQLEANIDDMTAEDLAYAQELLMRKGALDAWQESIIMKKGRLAVKLCALCNEVKKDSLVDIFLSHTSTLGVRYYIVERQEAERRNIQKEVDGFPVRVKQVIKNGKILRWKAEHDDCVLMANETGLTLVEIRRKLKRILSEDDY